ncbi:DUF1127 domain-containing protein [Tropicibacter oceani]|uniref:DUF1127 domain-containing protein n=1 Tax=Tropicibacter oceani TaxID=3058420 RepID=A0ABY8QDE3_9RHOB|nr:DUF1127 domain-containing protein [Tropicibacter oceani]WGW02654.1 DUF1127 domain-containing protein [Tropicibacter oceani]
MSHIATRDALSFLDAAHPLPPLTTFALRVAVVTAKWAQHRRTRKALGQLDDHLLKDVGLDRRSAQREARRMFWQG